MRQAVSGEMVGLAITDSGIVDDGVETAEPVDLRRHILGASTVSRSPVTTSSVRGSARLASFARLLLRAWRTTRCPCSTSSCPAIRPSPVDEPEMKTRAMDYS